MPQSAAERKRAEKEEPLDSRPTPPLALNWRGATPVAFGAYVHNALGGQSRPLRFQQGGACSLGQGARLIVFSRQDLLFVQVE